MYSVTQQICRPGVFFCPKNVIVLRPTHPHIKLVLGALSLELKWPGCELARGWWPGCEVARVWIGHGVVTRVWSGQGVNWPRGGDQGVKWPGWEFDHNTPADAEVKNNRNYNCTPSYIFMTCTWWTAYCVCTCSRKMRRRRISKQFFFCG